MLCSRFNRRSIMLMFHEMFHESPRVFSAAGHSPLYWAQQQIEHMANRVLALFRSRPARSQRQTVPDEELIAAVQEGDAGAWAEFLERYSDLIYTKAWEYSRTEKTARDPEAREDEASELYLFLCEYLRRSLKSFRGHCQPRTWIMAIAKNRNRVIKAYLMRKDPQRADVRLPIILDNPSREMLDPLPGYMHQIFTQLSTRARSQVFKQLVWGMKPAHIAQDLDLPQEICFAIEDLLRQHSPRVFERIQQNRLARMPTVAIDASGEEGEENGVVQLVDPGPLPDEDMEIRENKRIAQEGFAEGVASLSPSERRTLILLYNEGLTPKQIIRLATDEGLSLGKVKDEQQVYYLRRKAVGKILDCILQSGEIPKERLAPDVDRKELSRLLEELLQEQGIPVGAHDKDGAN